jgi:hypothetical protein
MTQENRKSLIITIVILLIAVFLISLLMSGVFQMEMTSPHNPLINKSPDFMDANSSPSKLPSDVKQDIDGISRDVVFSVNKWEFDPVKKDTIILYTYDIRNKSLIENLQGKQIRNYTLRIIHDIEFETTRKDVSDYLYDLRKNPDYQVNSVYMVTDRINYPPGNNAEVWVYNSTPENMKLDKTMIKGWKISVYPAFSPILTMTQTLQKNFSNTSS